MKYLMSRIFQAGGLAYYYLFVGPRGHGRPRSARSWDAQYRTGHWDNFESMDEMPRYAVIGSYIRNYGAALSVLDVGCGYGRLVKELHASSFARYVGIDLSSEAIARANSSDYPNASFSIADFTTWTTDAKFDIIVLNDTLYYAEHPVAVLDRYFAMLADGGSIIVGMFRHRNTMVIWKDIARRFAFAHSIEVRNGKGELTDIRVLVRTPPPQRASSGA